MNLLNSFNQTMAFVGPHPYSAFTAGYWAYDSCSATGHRLSTKITKITDNPHPYGCQEHSDWEAGFENARDEWMDE